jgi:signal transduction histidine kinase/HAMP domain-containing protein
MKWLANLSIRGKLIAIILVCTISALGVGFTLITIANVRAFKQDMVRNTSLLAQVIGDYNTAALGFDAMQDAEQSLAKLTSVSSVRYACLYNKSGQLFAEYLRKNAAKTVQRDSVLQRSIMFDSTWQGFSEFYTDELILYRRIEFNGEIVGTVFLRTSTAELDARIRSYVITMAGVGVSIVIASLVLALWLQRIISGRIVALAKLMKRVSVENDYELRFTRRGGNDEIGELADGFNDMLSQIQRRETERDNAREALATALREDFRETVRNLQNLVVRIARSDSDDESGTYVITLLEGKIAAQFGMDTDKARGKTLREVFGSRTYAAQIANVDAAFRGKTVQFESRALNGNYLTILVPIIEQGRVREIVCSTVEITQQKQAEERLRVSEQRYRALVQGLPVGILQSVRSQAGIRLEFVNTEFAKQTGYTTEMFAEIMHSGDVRLPVHPDDKAEMDRQFQAWLQQDSDTLLYRTYRLRILKKSPSSLSSSSSSLLLTKQDEYRWFDDYSTKVRLNSGETVIIQAFMDVTEKKTSEDQLQKSLEKERQVNVLKTRFVSTVSHEFRTPLAGILLSVDLLSRYYDRIDTEKRLMELQKVRARVNELTDLMNDFLAQSESQSAIGRFKPIPMNIVEFSKNIAAEMEFVASATSRTRIQRNIDIREAFVNGDVKLLRYVIRNLLSNAIKYSLKGTPIIVNVSCEPEWVVISVKDEGIGIPESDMEHLFKPFFRASNALTMVGSGVGLSIVKEFVEIHGGNVKVQSHLREGSVFTVRLPLMNDEEVAAYRTTLGTEDSSLMMDLPEASVSS